MLQMPTFTVKLKDADEFTVVVSSGLQARWELERARKGWPAAGDAPTVWGSWLAWSAAKKENRVKSSMPYDAFVDQLESMSFGDESVDPTSEEPEDG